MSNCPCEGSGNCNVGPQMRINDLPIGEQVVTTVKREKIPEEKKPDKPKPTPIWPFLLIVYFVAILLWILADDSYAPPPEDYPPANPPTTPYPPCPSPEMPVCPW